MPHTSRTRIAGKCRTAPLIPAGGMSGRRGRQSIGAGDFDGATYVEHEGEVELLPGIRLLPAPGHTDGHQVVVVETDVGVWFGELGSGTTEGQCRLLALGAPTWLSHAAGPKIPERRPDSSPRPGS